jgi:hypothetical protein
MQIVLIDKTRVSVIMQQTYSKLNLGKNGSSYLLLLLPVCSTQHLNYFNGLNYFNYYEYYVLKYVVFVFNFTAHYSIYFQYYCTYPITLFKRLPDDADRVQTR